MAQPLPMHCRREAFELLAAQLPTLETTRGLVRAATAISLHELDEEPFEEVERQIEEIAGLVKRRLRSRDPRAILAHAHEVLFEEQGFAGDNGDYYHPQNSYLPLVMKRKRGLPITLAIVYKAVLDELGLSVEGVNAPGHFLTRVDVREQDERPPVRLIIDPFARGRMLTEKEAVAQAQATAGLEIPPGVDPLPRASHRDWVLRMLQNLIAVYGRTDRRETLGAMLEMRALVEQA